MRCFLAFELPEETSKKLMSLKDSLAVKGVKPSAGFHLTLQFFGEVDEKRISEIKNVLKEIKFEPFDASLDGVGVFPNETYVRVVWLGLEPKDKFMALQKLFASKLKEIGFEQDKDFLPHITLARVKFIDDTKSFVDKIKVLKVPEVKFKVDKVKLFKSSLSRDGAVYEVIAEF